MQAVKGSVYTRTDVGVGALNNLYFKRQVDTQYGWTGVMAKPLGGETTEVYAHGYGDDQADGLSWGSACRTVEAATARLQGGAGTVKIGRGAFPPFTAGGGVTYIGSNQGVGGNSSVIVPTDPEEDGIKVLYPNCHFENLFVRGTFPVYRGRHWYVNGATASSFRRCFASNRDDITYNATDAGTGWWIANTEGASWDSCGANRTSLAFDFVTEASVNKFFNTIGSINYQILRMTQASGGNAFLVFKMTGCGDPATPSLVFDLGGGSNQFTMLDINEAGPSNGLISSPNNTFLGCVWAPGMTMKCTSHHNSFRDQRILGRFEVPGNYNTLDTPRALGYTEVTGVGNIVLNPEGTVYGTYLTPKYDLVTV